jgi:hypothetical protein
MLNICSINSKLADANVGVPAFWSSPNLTSEWYGMPVNKDNPLKRSDGEMCKFCYSWSLRDCLSRIGIDGKVLQRSPFQPLPRQFLPQGFQEFCSRDAADFGEFALFQADAIRLRWAVLDFVHMALCESWIPLKPLVNPDFSIWRGSFSDTSHGARPFLVVASWEAHLGSFAGLLWRRINYNAFVCSTMSLRS